MSAYQLFSDATLDLPHTTIEELDIQVIPMHFDLAENSYRHFEDERELSLEEFYRQLRAGASAVTSQITPVVYEELFEPVLQAGQDILYIAFSSGLSGTVNNAMLMAGQLEEKYPGRRIVVIDSLCASIGEGLLVYYAAKKRLEGLSLEELAAWVMEYRTRVAHWFTVDDLNHLKRGGRISAVEAIVGTALNIKPILSVDGEGKLTVMAKVRGSRKALEYVLSRLSAEGKDLEGQKKIGKSLEADVALTVPAEDAFLAEMDAETLADLVRQTGLVKDVLISKIGPIIGTHTSAGMTALVFLK